MTAQPGVTDYPPMTALVPHDGAMCLLSRVLAHDHASILCEADSHRRTDNPLRVNGRLDALVAIEYAAQAMAAHGALTAVAAPGGACTRPRAGYLVGVRDFVARVDRLDDLPAALTVHAIRVAAGDTGSVYRFEIDCASIAVASGRATVMLRTEAQT